MRRRQVRWTHRRNRRRLSVWIGGAEIRPISRIVLTGAASQRFLHDLASPPAPNAALRAAWREYMQEAQERG